MEIKDYVLTEEQLEQISRRPKKKKKSRKPHVEYRVLFQSGCDFGIEKKMGKKTSQLIILVSKQQYYVMESGVPHALNATLFKQFLAELGGELLLPEVNWLTSLENDRQLISNILELLRHPMKEAQEMLKRGLLYAYSFEEIDNRMSVSDSQSGWFLNWKPDGFYRFDLNFYQWIIEYMAKRRAITKKELFQKLLCFETGKKETLLMEGLCAFMVIHRWYGVEWAKKAVVAFLESPVEDRIDEENLEEMLDVFLPGVKKPNSFGEVMNPGIAEYEVQNPTIVNKDQEGQFLKELECTEKERKKQLARRLPPAQMIDYLMHHSCREGYAYSMAEFLNDWKQCLIMQKLCYGKIREKYPQYLKSALKKLSYETKVHQEEIEERVWKASVKKMEKLEYSDGKYKMICPKNKTDLLQEADRQHNCLAGYAGKVMRGEEQIFFMRKCEDQETSLVTVEVEPGGHIGQIFRAFNEAPSEEEMQFLRKWAGEKNLAMPINPIPPRGAGYDPMNDLDHLIFPNEPMNDTLFDETIFA